MGERSFTKALYREGSAIQIREKILNSDQEYWQNIELIDYELYFLKNQRHLLNSLYRDILIFPTDNYTILKIPAMQDKMFVTANIDANRHSLFITTTLKIQCKKQNTILKFNYIEYNGMYTKFLSSKDLKLVDFLYEHDLNDRKKLSNYQYLDIVPFTPTICCQEIILEGYFLMSVQHLNNIPQIDTYCPKDKFDEKYVVLSKVFAGLYPKNTIYILTWYKDSELKPLIHESTKNKNYIVFWDYLQEHQPQVLLKNHFKLDNSLTIHKMSKLANTTSEICLTTKLQLNFDDELQCKQWYDTLMQIIKSNEANLSEEDNEESKNDKIDEYPIGYNIFINYPLIYQDESAIAPPLPSSSDELHFTFSCQDIVFALRLNDLQIEPYKTCVAVYDAKHNCRVTETFEFDINLSLTTDHIGDCGIPASSSAPTTASFEIHGPHDLMYVVICVEKILLKGSITECTAPYRNLSRQDAQNNKCKAAEKYYKTVKDQRDKYGASKVDCPWMPFAIAVKPLLTRGQDSKLKLNTDGAFGIYTFPHNNPGPSDAEQCGLIIEEGKSQTLSEMLVKFLREYRKVDKIRHTIIPGQVLHTMALLDDSNVLGESLVEKINEFDHPSRPLSSYKPHGSMINRLYIYPKHLNYQEQSSFPRARNIYCLVECKETDDYPNGSGLPVFNGASQVCTSVFYHDPSPSFSSEIRVDLPLVLTPKHHLLFTFYHVSVNNTVKPQDKQKNSFSTPVGYTWIPLIQGGKLINGPQELPVCTSLCQGYLSYPHPSHSSRPATQNHRQSTILTDHRPSTNGNANVNGHGLSASELLSFGSSKELLSTGSGNNATAIKWVEGGKALFKVAFDSVSAIYTKDTAINELFAHIQVSFNLRETETLILLEKMNQASSSEIIKHSHAVFTLLLYLLPKAINVDMAQTIYKLIVKIIDDMNTNGLKGLIQDWIERVMDWDLIKCKQAPLQPNTQSQPLPLFHTFLKVMSEMLKPTMSDQLLIYKIMNNFNHLSNMTLKCMGLWLDATDKGKDNRKERFTSEFLYDCKNLCLIITSNIAAGADYHTGESKAWSISLANFIQGLFAMVDRGFTFELIYSHIANLDNFAPHKATWNIKMDFMEKLLEYEHFLPLNLPLLSKWGVMLNDQYLHHHFLVGLLFRLLEISMNHHTEIRARVIVAIRNLLIKHSLDPRYQTKDLQSQIALLYLPLIGLYMANIEKMSPKMHLHIVRNIVSPHKNDCTSSNLSPETMKETRQSFQGVAEYKESHPRTSKMDGNKDILSLIAGQELIPATNKIVQSPYVLRSPLSKPFSNSFDTSSAPSLLKLQNGHQKCQSLDQIQESTITIGAPFVIHPFNAEEKMDAYISIVYILNTIRECDKLKYFETLRAENRESFLDLKLLFVLLYETLQSFSYNWEQNQTFSANEIDGKPSANMWFNCCAQISFAVAENISLLGQFLKFSEKILTQDDDVLIEIAIDVCCALLQDWQADRVIITILSNLDKFVMDVKLRGTSNSHKLYTKLFYQVLSYFGMVYKECLQIFGKCNSRIVEVRKHACNAFYKMLWNLYILHRQRGPDGFDITKNLVMVALSQFLGDDQAVIDDRDYSKLSNATSYIGSLSPSLDLLCQPSIDLEEASYASVIRDFQSNLGDLLSRISAIQTSLAALNEMPHTTEIPEIHLDLEERLARSYSYNPELRRTWLVNMAKLNAKFANYTEAAFCYLHSAAIITRFLALKDDFYEKWQVDYAEISPNIVRDEYELTNNYLASNLCMVKGIYTQSLLVETLYTAVKFVEKSQRFELLDDIYHMLIGLSKRDQKYEKIFETYEKLSHAYANIAELTLTGKRYFGQYYKVNFYGKSFDKEDTREFVYKEPHVTRLSEVSLRLKAQYTELLGDKSVQLITHSGEVETHLLDSSVAHIQITHLQPYIPDQGNTSMGFDLIKSQKVPEEYCKIMSTYELNNRVQYFYFEVPFTKTAGKTYGDIAEQYKKKVIVKSQYCFPYIKTRIPIVWKTFVELSPLEAAIDEMQRKVREFKDLYALTFCDIVKLQLQLQGAISTQINSGPLAYAQAFLSSETSVEWDPDLKEKLKNIFISFIRIVQKCIHLHAKNYHKDQTDFHHMIESHFTIFVREVATILNESIDVLLGTSCSAISNSPDTYTLNDDGIS